MNNQPSIDDWFKKQFEGFAPDAPDVWGSVQQGIQAANAATGTATVAKTAISVGTKWVIATALVATIASAVVYTIYQTQNTPAEQKVTAGIEPLKSDYLIIEKDEPAPSAVIEQTRPKLENSPLPSVPNFNKTNAKPNDEVVPLEQSENAEQTNHALEQTVVNPSLIDQSIPQKTQAVSEPSIAVVESEHQTGTKQRNVPTPVALNSLPTAITPNGDGLNDTWVIDWEDVQYTFVIIDQKGNLVYESKPNEPSWNGVNGFTGQLCEKGNYIFVIRYQRNGADNQEQKTGPLRINY